MIEKSKWIWADCDFDVNSYADFKLEFEIDSVDNNAVFEICADTEYVAYINGQLVGCGQYDDFPENKSYDTYSVAQLLNKGKNTLYICGYYQGGLSMQYKKGVDALCFALKNNEQVFLSDENVMAAVNTGYTSGEIFMTTGQVGYGFMYDANKTDLSFKPAVVKEFDTEFMPRPIKRTKIGESLETKIIAQGYFLRKSNDDNIALRMYTDFLSHRNFDDIFEGEQSLPGCASLTKAEYDGTYVLIDFGKEEAGFLSFDLNVDKGALIEIGYGEHLDDLRVRTSIKSRQFANSYIARGGRQQFTYYYKRIAGRYLQLHISGTNTLEIYYAGVKPNFYPVTRKSSFKCNDHLHNKIHDISIDTLRHCMHEHYEDCPWREQALYGSDSRNQMLCCYYVFDDNEFAKQSLILLGKSFGEDGIQAICAPTDITLKIPSFTHVWFLAVKDYTQYTNDTYFVDNMWNDMEKAIEVYAENNFSVSEAKDYWNFYEWSEGYENDNPKRKAYRFEYNDFDDGIAKVFMYLALDSMLWLAKRYNKADFVNKYQPIAAELKDRINNKYWNEEKGLYSSYYYNGKHQHYGELMQAMCLYTGIAEGKEEALCEVLANPDNGMPDITISYSLYKYDALLSQGGKYDKFVFDDIAEKWGSMLYSGATTFWETIKGADDFLLAGSLCHGWSAIPLYMYYRYAAGITPEMLTGNGGASDIRNVFSELECRCGEIGTTKGKVVCDYKWKE